MTIKKVVAIIGSLMGEKSCTAQLAMKIIKNAQLLYGSEMEFEVITLDQLSVQPCGGCCQCFKLGKCPLDEKDEMPKIKEKLLEADFIIWGSPVYAHQVSGQMKTVIDRISYWTHLFRLAGKPGIILTTTSSSGHREVIAYLNKIMTFMGVKVVAGYYALTVWQGIFCNEENVDKIGEKAGALICSYLKGEKKVKASSVQEEIFFVMKESILKSRETKLSEYEFWENAGYFKYDCFQSLLNDLGNENKI